jgi:phosphate-selective porin OprO and OprP
LRRAFVIAATLLAAGPVLADDAHTYIAPTVLMQTDFQALPQEEENTGFALTRFRIGAYSQPTDWILALAQIEFTPADETPSVLDAYVRIGPWHGLRLSVGYLRSPLFVSARNELDGMAPFPELSMPVKALWPDRDLAVELHYAPPLFPFEAWLRFGNGNPSPTTNDLNDSFAFTARLDATLGRGRIDTGGEQTYGLRVGVGAVLDDSSYDRAGASGITASEFQFYRPPTVSGTRRVIEGHALAYFGPVRALLEVGGAIEDRSVSNGSGTGPRTALDPEVTRGGSIELAWMITGQKRIASVWPLWNLGRPFSFAHPAVEVAARAERLDVGLGMRDFARGGATGGSLAANVYLNALFGLTLAGYYYRYDVAPIEEPTRLDSWLFQARLTVYLNPPPLGPIGLIHQPVIALR